jgi:uncharacterized membrane protein
MAFQWWKFLHIAAAFGFLLAHGVSAGVFFRLRNERDRAKILEMRQLSGSSVVAMYVSIAVLLVSGIVSAFLGHYWGSWWIWAAIGILISLMAEMSIVGRRYYEKVAEATQLRESGVPRVSDEELDELMRSRVPIVNAVIGFAGLLVILWLMVFKPGL